MKRMVLLLALASTQLLAAPTITAPPPDKLPELAQSLAGRLASKTLAAPDGKQVAVGTILDEARLTTALKTIDQGQGWPAAWLIVTDVAVPYDLILRIQLKEDGTIADPDTMFLAARREWDDDAFDAAFKAATGKKPPREKQRNVVQQSFTKRTVTDYVYNLPKTGAGAKGLLALLPEGSYLRDSTAVDLRDGMRHTVAIVLNNPHFVPADCSTPEGMKTGHRDSGGITVVLTDEKTLTDSLDITDAVKRATGASMLPKTACAPGDTDAGAIDDLVNRQFAGREQVRLLNFTGTSAESKIDGLPVTVGIKKEDGKFKLFVK